MMPFDQHWPWRARAVSAAMLMTAVAVVLAGSPRASSHPALAGTWTLDLGQSHISADTGFDPGADTETGETSAVEGGRGRRAMGGGTLPATTSSLNERSEDDYARGRQLLDEITNPPATLTITEANDAVTIASGAGASHARTFHPNGKQEFQELDHVAVATKTRWVGADLVVDYTVFEGETLRYTYSRENDQAPLVIRIGFIEKGVRGNQAETTLVYEAAKGGATSAGAR